MSGVTTHTPTRVAHYGLGTIGLAITAVAARIPGIESVCFIDKSPALAGRDAGEVTGLGHLAGMTIQPSASNADLREVDVVLHSTSSSLVLVAPQLEECVKAHCHVVSTCEELAYPFRAFPEIASSLDQKAHSEGVTVLGTGVNPGFVMDALPAFLATASAGLERAEVVRVVDTAKRRPQLRAKTGAGLAATEFEARVASGEIRHVGLVQSAEILSRALNWEIDTYEESVRPVVADSEAPDGDIQAGHVLGVRQRVVATSRGTTRIVLDLQMSLGARAGDEITLYGSQTTHATIAGGIEGDTATAAIAVHAAARVAAAGPGLKTVLDLPLAWRPPSAAP